MIKFFKYFFQSLIIYLFFILGRILGLKNSQKIFSKIFQILGPKFKSNIIINQNLEKFNKNISISNKNDISEQVWSNYGKTFIEYIFLDKYKKQSNFITLNNQNILDDIIKEKKPVVFVSGHFANFELMSMEITKKKIKLATIYRPLNNFFLNPLMEYLRKKYICKNQIKKGINGVREAIDYIKNNHSIALMIDQRVSEGEKVDFFNKPALTTTLPAQLSIKFNLNIIPVFIQRKGIDKFEIEFQNKIEPSNFKDKLKLTKKLNEALEEMINRNPNQWIWTHNRWK